MLFGLRTCSNSCQSQCLLAHSHKCVSSYECAFKWGNEMSFINSKIHPNLTFLCSFIRSARISMTDLIVDDTDWIRFRLEQHSSSTMNSHP